jgi:two-component system, OmpR family, sensor histidine kinase KdpD
MFLLGRLSAAVAAVAVITSAFQLIKVNPTTVALTYVVAVLLIATQWGITEATAASLTAMFAFNFFFLPPVGRLTIADPQNWVALVAFLITAIVASQLSGRAKERNVEAISRQRDLERLYALSRALLLLSDNSAPIPGAIARHIADVFELETVADLGDRLRNRNPQRLSRNNGESQAGSARWSVRHLDERFED